MSQLNHIFIILKFSFSWKIALSEASTGALRLNGIKRVDDDAFFLFFLSFRRRYCVSEHLESFSARFCSPCHYFHFLKRKNKELHAQLESEKKGLGKRDEEARNL